MIFLSLSILSASISFALTWYVRKVALERNVIDVPNERSSHKLPTPRAGGLAIVVATLAPLPILYWNREISSDLWIALGSSGVGIAALGLLDDLRSIRPILRLFVQAMLTIFAIYLLQGISSLNIGSLSIPSGFPLNVLCALGLVWLTNLYNFMDGIDGIAAIEALTTCAGLMIIFIASGDNADFAFFASLVFGAALGFLVWNFPRAQIFMGDVGSSFLGFAFGLVAISSARYGSEFLFAVLILLAVFIVDATVTLVRRLLRRQAPHLAHRSHAYQFAARTFNNHRIVSLSVAAINLVWLCPIALATSMDFLRAETGLLLAYVPLVALALIFRAGAEEASSEPAA